jgi:hypothetical protein
MIPIILERVSNWFKLVYGLDLIILEFELGFEFNIYSLYLEGGVEGNFSYFGWSWLKDNLTWGKGFLWNNLKINF